MFHLSTGHFCWDFPLSIWICTCPEQADSDKEANSLLLNAGSSFSPPYYNLLFWFMILAVICSFHIAHVCHKYISVLSNSILLLTFTSTIEKNTYLKKICFFPFYSGHRVITNIRGNTQDGGQGVLQSAPTGAPEGVLWCAVRLLRMSALYANRPGNCSTRHWTRLPDHAGKIISHPPCSPLI